MHHVLTAHSPSPLSPSSFAMAQSQPIPPPTATHPEYKISLSPCYYHISGWARGYIPVSEPCKTPQGFTNSLMESTKCTLCSSNGNDHPCIQISFGYSKQLAHLVSFAGRDWSFNGAPIPGLQLDSSTRAQLSRYTSPEQRQAGFKALAERIADEFKRRYPFVEDIYNQPCAL